MSKVKLLICIGAAALLGAALQPAQGSAKPARHHVYRGKTKQKLKIQLSTSPGRITLIRFKATLLCRDGSLLHADLSDFEGSAVERNGRFSDTQRGISDAVSWHGRLRGHRVSGVLRVTDRLESGVRCDSGLVSFEARRVA